MQSNGRLTRQGGADKQEHFTIDNAAGGMYSNVVGKRRESPSLDALEQCFEGRLAACVDKDEGAVFAHEISAAFVRDLKISVSRNDMILLSVLREIPQPSCKCSDIGSDVDRAGEKL
jgi:hypothetical protein